MLGVNSHLVLRQTDQRLVTTQGTEPCPQPTFISHEASPAAEGNSRSKVESSVARQGKLPHSCPIPTLDPSAVPTGGTAAFISDAHCSQEQYEEYYFSALGKISKSNIESGLQHMPRRLL